VHFDKKIQTQSQAKIIKELKEALATPGVEPAPSPCLLRLPLFG